MLEHPADVIRALQRYADVFDPRSGSIIAVGSAQTPGYGDPFRGGLVSRFEERWELVRRIQRLDERKRRVLSLWYISSLPVVQIARTLHLSRMHCYRLRNQALHELANPPEREQESPREPAERPLPPESRTIVLDEQRVPAAVSAGT